MDKQLDNDLVTLYETCLTEQSPNLGQCDELMACRCKTPLF